jgi:hypothetical protein
VQRIKANAALASKVSQTVQQILKERGKRREEMAKLAAALAASAAAPTRLDKRAGTARETPNQYVNLMQAARLGRGTNPTPNLELAAQIAEEAVDAFPGSPKVLFEAAGCHQLLAEKGTLHSAMVRYVHMKEAYSLYQQCLTILAGPPYVTLKDEYDQWRKGLAELILKAQKELAHLQEQQERLG